MTHRPSDSPPTAEELTRARAVAAASLNVPTETVEVIVHAPEAASTNLVTVEEAAEKFGMSARQLWRLVKSGEVPSVRLGHAVRVDLARIQGRARGARKYDEALVREALTGRSPKEAMSWLKERTGTEIPYSTLQTYRKRFNNAEKTEKPQ